MKIFTSDAIPPLLPREWLAAVGSRPHIQQGEVIAVAENRAHLAELLAAVGARELAGSLRLRRGEQSTPNQALIDAGAVDPEVPGVYVYERAVKDTAVVRVTPQGCAVVARFRLPSFAAGITAEAVRS